MTHISLSTINKWLFTLFTVYFRLIMITDIRYVEHFNTSWLHLQLDSTHSLARKSKSDYPLTHVSAKGEHKLLIK